MDIIDIPLELIDEDKDQPRYQFDEESLQELMNSIGELGLLSPIKVRSANDGRYQIIYGNRRYKACHALGLHTIPCIVSAATDELEIYLEQIAENLTREGFSPIEEAEAFHKLMNDQRFNSSTKYLSSKLGKPESYIKNKCDLLKFGNAVKKLIVSGAEIKKDRLTEDQLKPVKDLPIEYRDPLALIIARDELPVSDVKKIVRLFKDNGITEGTKNKLLLKTGPGLLETWSVYQHNKAERAKQAETAAQAEQAVEDMPAGDQDPAPVKVTRLERYLNKMLSALPEHTPLSENVIQSHQEIAPLDRERFVEDIETLLDNMEKHLKEWKAIREAVKSAAAVEK